MPLHLLDTNILSDLIRRPAGPAAQRIMAMPPADLCTSIIVAAELRYGAERRGSVRLTNTIETILLRLSIRAFDAPADTHYAAIRTMLEREGKPIGQNDLLIAAQCLAIDAVLVTDNESEFRRVAGLKVENWLR